MAIGKPPSAQQQDARRQAPKASRLGRFGQAPTLNTDPGLLSSASQFTENRIRANKEELTRAKSLAKATTFNQLDAMTNEVLRPLLTAEGANVQKEWHSAQEKFAENFDKIRERYAEEDFEKDLMPLYEKASAGFQATGQTHVARELHKVAKREHTQQVARQQDSSIRNIIKEDMSGADAFINGIDGSTGDDFTALTGYADLLGMTSKADEDINIDGEPDQRTALVEKYVSDTLVESIQGLATSDKLAQAKDIYKKYKDRIDPSLYPKLDGLFKTMEQLDVDNQGLDIAYNAYVEPDRKKRQEIVKGLIAKAPTEHKGKLFKAVNGYLNTMESDEEAARRQDTRQVIGGIHNTVSKMIQDNKPKAEIRQTYQDYLNRNAVLLGNNAISMTRYFESLLSDEPKETNMDTMRKVLTAYMDNPLRASKDFSPYDPEVINNIHGPDHAFVRSLFKGNYDRLLQGATTFQKQTFGDLLSDSDVPEDQRAKLIDDFTQIRLQGDAQDPEVMQKLFRNFQEIKALRDASKAPWYHRVTFGLLEPEESERRREYLEQASQDITLNTPSSFPLTEGIKSQDPTVKAMVKEAEIRVIQQAGGQKAAMRLPKSDFYRRWQIEYALLRRGGVTVDE